MITFMIDRLQMMIVYGLQMITSIGGLACKVINCKLSTVNCKLFIFIFLTLQPLTASAQVDTKLRDIYTQAESDYQIGRIEQARDALLQNLSTFHGNLRQNALRLVALCYLARFDMEQTEQYATLMLQENPYYSPSSGDPETFADMVNSIKAGMTATITTASSQAESLDEVPVPTTLITAEMIVNSGARNLQEVLAAYVPGMNIIDCNDDINIAMRGIYSSTQDKILIMLNGHRLNSYATNTAAPDFSISLENVKQIEVLRGPASSLYGDVALTSVVNIITKQGADVDGVMAKLGAGNYGQIKADAVFGKRYFDIDLLVWGSIYRNSGEQRDASDDREAEGYFSMPYDHIRIRRVGNRPTYDFGLQLGYKGLLFMYDTHFSQVIAPFTMSSLALSYDHDRYRTYNGLSPCFSTSSHHADLSYQSSISNLQFKIAATYDKSDLTRYQVISDEPMTTWYLALPFPPYMIQTFDSCGGFSRYVNGQEQNYGFHLKGNYAYKLGDNHHGNISFGAEYGHFQLDDIRYQVGYNFEETFPEETRIRETGKGSENRADAWLQLKHRWDFSLFSRPFSLIANAGLRFDYKNRYDDSKVRELSPRAALILQRPRWSVRLSYSKSFVDAPFINRKANDLAVLLRERAPIILSPERVHSFQLSFAGNNWLKGLNFEVNGFYNHASDLIMTNIIDYSNVAQNKTCGVELMAGYRQPKFTADWNFTWTHTFRANLINLGELESFRPYYNNDIDDNNNTPVIMSNLVLGWQATSKLKLHTHVLFEGRQISYNPDIEQYVQLNTHYIEWAIYKLSPETAEKATAAWDAAVDAAQKSITHLEMPARCILNVGGEYTIGPVTLGLNIHNLLGTRYNRSGMNTNLIPQQGRWFMGSIAVRL
jgi:iron complex outermembrane receptor protein